MASPTALAMETARAVELATDTAVAMEADIALGLVIDPVLVVAMM